MLALKKQLIKDFTKTTVGSPSCPKIAMITEEYTQITTSHFSDHTLYIFQKYHKIKSTNRNTVL